jgi:D-glycero-alpha-D-manno-heptose 1-phosphate guanylyltransferase
LEAIILAGGLGTRLREAVPDLPKPMAPVNGKPFLEYVIRNLKKNGFSRIILSVGYMSEKIQNYFGDEYEGIEIVYSREDKPLGTGGGIRLALDHCLEDHAFIFNGDTYLDLEVSGVEDLWRKNRLPIIVGKFMEDSGRYGCIQEKAGSVVKFQENIMGSSGLVNVGCYVFNVNQLNIFDVGVPFSLERDYFAKFPPAQDLNCFKTNGYFLDIGIPEDYKRAEIELPLSK